VAWGGARATDAMKTAIEARLALPAIAATFA
jgi:hypothetical protein